MRASGLARASALALAAAAVAQGGPALAQEEWGAPSPLVDGVTLDPLFAARLRYETVDLDSAARDAEALTLRLRAGAELRLYEFSLLAEAEGTAALVGDYNDTIPGNGIEPFPVVPDPENLELNRLQIGWRRGDEALTAGRQRIIHDNAHFVGNVGWRQNEQTFDAVRGQAGFGPVRIDASYAIAQRTPFGNDSPNEHFDGDFVLLNAGVDTAPLDAKAFAYLLDYDERVAFSSQTYGVLASGTIALPGVVKLDVLASHATQTDYGAAPVDYRAEYWNAQLGATLLGFGLAAGYEELGSDGGRAAFQTPLATLHAFNGWADLFLTTPGTGLRDYYATLGRGFDTLSLLPNLQASVTYHRFKSDVGGMDYGDEWDASVGFRVGPVELLAKYANYGAEDFAVDTEKAWLQADLSF